MRVFIALLMLMLPLPAFAAGEKVCFPDGKCVGVEVVRSDDDMARGLSGRKELAADQGMLFAFSGEGAYRFWMKDMLFNLDICWIDRKGNVVDVHENVPPCTPQDCPVITPAGIARYVLEINAGQAAKHGLKKGSRVTLKGI